MGFETLNLKFSYNSEEDSLLRDFYLPVLRNAHAYDRAVGYFSAGVLNQLAEGLHALVSSGGSMRLIIGDPLSEDEYEAISNETFLEEKVDQLFAQLDSYLFHSETQSNGLRILAWLIATERLEIKFALRQRGMFHQKIGVVRDKKNNTIAFEGSANETFNALDDQVNSEHISIYPSYDRSFETHGVNLVKVFEKLWKNETPRTKVIDITSDHYKHLRQKVNSVSVSQAVNFVWDEVVAEEKEEAEGFPSIPETFKGQPFQLHPHQREALRKWKENKYKGLLKLATGAGKTITSIYGAVSLVHERLHEKKATCLIICVPYIELADQWVSELGIFNIIPHQCYGSRAQWEASFRTETQLLRAGENPFVAAVVVNKTLCSQAFQQYISSVPFDDLIIIGDECHHHGSVSIAQSLPQAKYRLGLSATPFTSDEDKDSVPFPNMMKQRILNFYGGIVSEYSLADAIDDQVLTPYLYHVVPCYLTQSEQDEYDELSESINKLVVMSQSGTLSDSGNQALLQMCSKRSCLLGGAVDKLSKLHEVLQSLPENERQNTLFYTGEGKQPDTDIENINAVSDVLSRAGWKISKFTSKESKKDRRVIMDAFREGKLDALVAMKVLDEGIDIPVCSTAFILASTRNERQYVQRRGRILRRAADKSCAVIYDFITLPSPEVNSGFSEKLEQDELCRIKEFSSLSLNKNETEVLLENIGLFYV